MNAKQCDRCKKLYSKYDIEEKEFNVTRRKRHKTYVSNQPIDLCPECLEALNEWFKECEK